MKNKIILTICLFGLFFMFLATRSTLWDRDEPRYARAAVEMVQSGNYLYPTFNGRPWVDKPILYYWLTSATIRLFGPSEFAVRLFSVLGLMLTFVFTYRVAKKLFEVITGLLSILMLGTSMMILAVGASATIEGILLPCTLGVMLMFILSLEVKGNWRHGVIMGIFLGLSFLAKGPAGLLPLIAILCSMMFYKYLCWPVKKLLFILGIAVVIGVGIFMIWAAPANYATGGEIVQTFFGHHVIERILKPLESHGGNFFLYLPYYPLAVIFGFFPWTIHLPGAISATLGNRLCGRQGKIILICWVTSGIIIMTFAATKLPHYIISIWPALAIGSAAMIFNQLARRLSPQDIFWLKCGVWFFVPVGVLIGLALMIGSWFAPIPNLAPWATVAGIIMLAMTVFAGIQQLNVRLIDSTKWILIGMAAFLVPVIAGVIPALEAAKITPTIAKAVRQQTIETVPVATYEFHEPSLNYYIGRNIEKLRKAEDMFAWLQNGTAGVVIMPATEFEKLSTEFDTSALQIIARKKGFNYPKGKELEVVAVLRYK